MCRRSFMISNFRRHLSKFERSLRVLSSEEGAMRITGCRAWSRLHLQKKCLCTIQLRASGTIVPMIACPQDAEQHLNCKFLVHYLKVAEQLQTGKGNIMKRNEVEKVVRRVMVDSEGRAIRSRGGSTSQYFLSMATCLCWTDSSLMWNHQFCWQFHDSFRIA